MSEAPLRRRWFRFSLRTMFVVVTVFAVWLGWELDVVRRRQIILNEATMGQGLPEMHCPLTPFPHPSIRRLLGDWPVAEIALIPGSAESKLALVKSAFPEADAYIATDEWQPIGAWGIQDFNPRKSPRRQATQ